ncbi:hypothetical protein POJ06DRAFT_203929 [Lipomyces tetrasporus]|uniref:Short-chain dehydrogenase n=1 Tax=Lipomyces tetrasporus TaxID=54092 RepID=A0AAD7VNP8_9ASCO|nr:uncharacterized protein POJ06DRAFT_203929 [Lipomyces tetrasporus]KAJ8096472.1 hypothetical protein POJ06DRAFT_203929 [Lipomyces tetrasporus]
MVSEFNWGTSGDEVVRTFSNRVKDRIFVITGPSQNGIGAETACALAAASPAILVLAGRSESKVAPVIQSIRDINRNVKTVFIPFDLSSQTSVRAAAAEINQIVDKIDVLINNAGIMACPYGTTEDGIEKQFGTNHIGHFLFTNLLLDKIKAAGPGARIVNVASSAHRFGGIRVNDIGFKDGREYDAWDAYGQSKSANILFAKYFASKVPTKEIACIALHPGSILSELIRYTDMQLLLNARSRAEKSKLPNYERTDRKSLQQGCATTLVAALDPELQDKSGTYLSDCQVNIPAAHANDAEVAEKLWNLSEEIVGQRFPL